MTAQDNGAYSDAAIHAQLGGLNAKVDMILNDQKQARLDRKEQYAKQETLERRMDSVDSKLVAIDERIDVKLEAIDGRLDKMEPITTDIGKWKERFIGMRILIVFSSAVFGGLVVTFGKWLAVKLGLM
ncbi:DUF1515 domain-containing protein [Pseudomonas sp. R2.Fl]|nr:DUF1515 domain-containing protein [Pseudomonas sp. R2.Fl]